MLNSCYSLLLGIEYASSLLLQEAIGFGGLYCELIRVSDRPYLLSQSVQGESLKTHLQNNNGNLVKNNLDVSSLSKLILMLMVTSPEKEITDFGIKKTNNPLLTFLVIEQFEAVPGVPQSRLTCMGNHPGFFPGTEALKQPSLLFCLPQMVSSISEDVIDWFESLPIEKILTNWLTELKDLHSEITRMFPPNTMGLNEFSLQHFPGIMVSSFYERFIGFQNVLAAKRKSKENITLFDLLSLIDAKEDYLPLLKGTTYTTVSARYLELSQMKQRPKSTPIPIQMNQTKLMPKKTQINRHFESALEALVAVRAKTEAFLNPTYADFERLPTHQLRVDFIKKKITSFSSNLQLKWMALLNRKDQPADSVYSLSELPFSGTSINDTTLCSMQLKHVTNIQVASTNLTNKSIQYIVSNASLLILLDISETQIETIDFTSHTLKEFKMRICRNCTSVSLRTKSLQSLHIDDCPRLVRLNINSLIPVHIIGLSSSPLIDCYKITFPFMLSLNESFKLSSPEQKQKLGKGSLSRLFITWAIVPVD